MLSNKPSILHPINERFMKVFDEFMNNDLKEKARANNVRQYIEGIVDTLLRDKIEEHMKPSEIYKNYSWKRKLDCLEQYYDKDITDKIRKVAEVGGAGSHFWDDVSQEALQKIINIANHLIEDIFVKYFTSDEHKFGSENIYWYFSMLPLDNRIYILEHVYETVKNENVVDRLSLAYVKNGEQEKGLHLINEAFQNKIINEDLKHYLETKYGILEKNLAHVHDLNPNVDSTNNALLVNGNMVVVGFPSSKNIFEAEKAYKRMKAMFDKDKAKYPEFMNMLLMLMSRDSRTYR